MIVYNIDIKTIIQKLYKKNINIFEILFIIYFLVFLYNIFLYEKLNYNINDNILCFDNEIVFNIDKISKNNSDIYISRKNNETNYIENFIFWVFFSIEISCIFCILKNATKIKKYFPDVIYCIMYIYNKSRKKIEYVVIN